ncbi:MAG: winged helix-turn-helix domain-containing protein [Candidatus Sulfotelmatobacter sp.]
MCEPQLGKKGLYPTLSTRNSATQVRTMMNLIAYSDGSLSLVQIAEQIRQPMWELLPIVDHLARHDLIKKLRCCANSANSL